MINVYFSELPKTLTEILELKYDETMSYEERVQKRYDYIKEQYELDNKYEGWDFIEHIKYGEEFNHLITFDYLISTKGRILSLLLQEGRYKLLNGGGYEDYYKYQTLYVNKKRQQCRIHRTLSSTFIPKLNHYEQNLNLLIINHKDLNKRNNHFTNLEWCTSQENTKHQFIERGKNNIYFDQIFQGTIELDCKYKGVKFKVFGYQGLQSLGLLGTALSKVLTKVEKHAFGCTWDIITQKEADKLPCIPEFIKNKFLNDRKYLNHQITPLKGVVVKDCEYTGLEFVTYGAIELKSFGFDQGTVCKSLVSTRPHQGCLFEYISRDEAEELQRGLTKEQQKVIVKKRITK